MCFDTSAPSKNYVREHVKFRESTLPRNNNIFLVTHKLFLNFLELQAILAITWHNYHIIFASHMYSY